MTEELDSQKLKKDYSEFLEKIDPKLVDLIFSEKMSEQIADICLKNGVDDEQKIEGVAYRVVLVLLGKIPIENLAMTFELGVKLAPEVAKKIANEIKQFISPIAQSKSGENAQPGKELPKETMVEEKPKRPPSKDAYREPVE